MAEVKIPNVKITRHEVALDPTVEVFHVTLECEDRGVWEESFGSREKLEGFLSGLGVMADMMGMVAVRMPKIPKLTTSTFAEKKEINGDDIL